MRRPCGRCETTYCRLSPDDNDAFAQVQPCFLLIFSLLSKRSYTTKQHLFYIILVNVLAADAFADNQKHTYQIRLFQIKVLYLPSKGRILLSRLSKITQWAE